MSPERVRELAAEETRTLQRDGTLTEAEAKAVLERIAAEDRAAINTDITDAYHAERNR